VAGVERVIDAAHLIRTYRTAIGAALLAGAMGVAAGINLVVGSSARVVAALAGAGVVLVGIAVIAVAKALAPGEPDVEERSVKGPDEGRRSLILGAGVGAAVMTVTAVAFPAARRLGAASEALRTTPWVAGTRLVDPDGNPVVAAEVALGDLLTVYPDGAVGSVDGQAVLIREPVDRYVPDPERSDWVPDGIAVYSKLCTHMACPLGLYQQESGTLLCPCHQAVFDLLDGGRAVKGPARRALPQLPIALAPDGTIVATGDFSDAVGTGFWGRP
jgi:ubiquinol-cytochrome c reductase iron-sulfur subunit